jgi:hypothetical protein
MAQVLVRLRALPLTRIMRPSPAGLPGGEMSTVPRRVVTGHTPDGVSVVVSDGPVPVSRELPEDGVAFREVWSTSGAPALINAREEVDPTERELAVPPPPRGTKIRINEFAPGHLDERGLQSPVHRTESVDYGIVLDGEITLVLDDSEVTLRAPPRREAVQMLAEHDVLRGPAPSPRVPPMTALQQEAADAGGRAVPPDEEPAAFLQEGSQRLGHDVVVSVEAVDRVRPTTRPWVDEMLSKHSDRPVVLLVGGTVRQWLVPAPTSSRSDQSRTRRAEAAVVSYVGS